MWANYAMSWSTWNVNLIIPNNLNFDTWDEAKLWASENQHTLPALTVNQLYKVGQRRFPTDAFTLGQLASKIWLTSVVFEALGVLDTQDDIAYLGCWVGTLASWASIAFHAHRVFGFDSDPDSIDLADDYNSDMVEDNWRFKGVVADVNIIDWNDPEFVVDGELITDFVPDVIINTSAEHMSDDWFMTASKNTLVIMQSNNNPRFKGHINCVDSVETMKAQYPMKNVMYAGSMTTPAYTRFMQIGYPA